MTGPSDAARGLPLRLGLVGCGLFGRFVLDSAKDVSGAEVMALTDADRQRAAELAAEHGIAVQPDVPHLLADPDIDVVLVATPPVTHGPLVRAAAAAGKHVFCEKPLATDLGEAAAAVAAADRARTWIAVDYVMRWNPLYWLVVRLQALRGDDGAPLLGSLRRFAFENLAADERLPIDHWFWDRRRSGGIFVEHGVHFFDAAEWLIGSQPLSVQAVQVERTPGIVDTVIASTVHPGGCTASYYHAFTHADPVEYQALLLDWGFAHGLVRGWIPVDLELSAWTNEAGAASLSAALGEPTALAVPGFRPSGSEQIAVDVSDAGDLSDTIWRGRGEPRRVSRHVRVRATLGGEDAKARVYRECVRAGLIDLLEAVRHRRSPLIDGREALGSLATAVAAQEAADSGRTVALTSALS